MAGTLDNPQSKRELCIFLAMVYDEKSIYPNLELQRMKPLMNCLLHDHFAWTMEADKAFNTILRNILNHQNELKQLNVVQESASSMDTSENSNAVPEGTQIRKQ